MKKFAALFATLFLLLTACNIAMAEDNNDIYYLTCEQVEELFFEQFGYEVDVTLYTGLSHDPQGYYFRIPNQKGLSVYYLKVDAFSMDGSETYVNQKKVERFFEVSTVNLTLHPWEDLENPKSHELGSIVAWLERHIGCEAMYVDIITEESGDFTITMNFDGVEISHKFGSAWAGHIDGTYHQAVITKLFEDWCKANDW